MKIRWRSGPISLKQLVLIAVLLLALIAVLVFKDPNVKQISFMQQSKIQEVSFSSHWSEFQNKINLTGAAKIKDFKLIYDKEGLIYKVEFDLIDNKEYYMYKHCFSCTNEVENKVSLIRNTQHEQVPYADQYITGDLFFNKLDFLKTKPELLDQQKFAYYLIQSSGRNEGISYKGDYFELIENDFRKLAPLDPPEESYKGFNIQIVGNEHPTSFGTGENNTKSVIIR